MRLVRTTGISSVIGGAAWVAACFVHNSLPQGCIGDGCEVAPMRGSSPTGVVLFALAGAMLAVSGVGLLLLSRRESGLGRLGMAAGVAGGLGLVLLGAAGVVSLFVDNDWWGMPGLVVPGILLLAVGLVLVALAVFRAGVLPVWTALMLLATALLLPFANEQTSRILLAVPFGIAWAAAGAVLLRGLRPVVRAATAA